MRFLFNQRTVPVCVATLALKMEQFDSRDSTELKHEENSLNIQLELYTSQTE